MNTKILNRVRTGKHFICPHSILCHNSFYSCDILYKNYTVFLLLYILKIIYDKIELYNVKEKVYEK